MNMNGTSMLIGVTVLALGVSPLAISTSEAQRATGVSRVGWLEVCGQAQRPYFDIFFADAGGLMTYGATASEIYTNAAEQVAKVLGGTPPRELPLRQATRFELVINNWTAKALGLTIPPSLLARADEVIEQPPPFATH